MAKIVKVSETALTKTATIICEKSNGKVTAASPNEFAEKIRILNVGDRFHALSMNTKNGYYGLRVAQTAETYIRARMVDGVAWNYNSVCGIFDYYNDAAYKAELKDIKDDTPQSNDSEENDSPDSFDQTQFAGYNPMGVRGVYRLYGYATKPKQKAEAKTIAPLIDCSTFVGLALRGIPYENSPWKKYGNPAKKIYTWNPANIRNLYGKEGWEQTVLDEQPAGLYKDIGIPGCTTARNASELADFYSHTGAMIYDRVITTVAERNANKPSANYITSKIQPGDLLFFSGTKKDKNGNTVLSQPNRFRCVSHVALVAVDPTYLLEVTNGENSLPNAVYNRPITDTKLEGLTMVVRPDYRPRVTDVGNKIGENLLLYPWGFSKKKSFTSESGITITNVANNGLKIKGTTSKSMNIYLKGSGTHQFAGLWLTKGTYELSGMDGTGIKGANFSIRVYHNDTSEFATPIRCYDGHNVTFKIDNDEQVNVRLYLIADRTVDCTIYPKLVRKA